MNDQAKVILTPETRRQMRDKISRAISVNAAVAVRLSEELEAQIAANQLSLENIMHANVMLYSFSIVCDKLQELEQSLTDEEYNKVMKGLQP